MSAQKIIDHPSPNFGDRAAGSRIDMLILHYTGMKSSAESLEKMCDPAAEVSAHYLIDEAGTIFRLVDEEHRAWHAGASYWAGTTDINSCSIGIELQNPGHDWGYTPFPENQMRSLIALGRDIMARNDISPSRVLGHSDVAPARKQDPGHLFDWEGLAAEGIGLWPVTDVQRLQKNLNTDEILSALTTIGYDSSVALSDLITAFQRHWRQTSIDGEADEETQRLIKALDQMSH